MERVGVRIPLKKVSRFEPLNLECKWSKIAILRNMLWHKRLLRLTLGRFMGRGIAAGY